MHYLLVSTIRNCRQIATENLAAQKTEFFNRIDPKEIVKLNKVGAGIAIGVAIGVGIGAAMDNVGAGIAIGIAIGAAVGASQQKKGD